MMRMLLGVARVVACLVAIACNSSQECVDRSRELEAVLARIPAGGQQLLRAGIGLPADELPVLDDAIAAEDDIDDLPVVVRVRADIADFGGLDPVASSPDALVDALEREILANEHFGNSTAVVIVAGPNAAWSTIAMLLEASREVGKTEVDLVFARATAIPRPPSSSVTAELADLRAPAGQRAVAAANIAAKIADPCPPIGEAFMSVATFDAPTRMRTLIAEMPRAMQACGCKADGAALASVLHFILAPDFVPAVVRLSLAPKTALSPETLAFGSDVKWRDAYTQVVAARDRPMRFVTIPVPGPL